MQVDIYNLSFSYKKTKLYKNLNFKTNKSQVYLILGKNGMGKTTLLKLVSGLLSPNEGSVSFDSSKSFPRNINVLKNLFFIPEEFESPNISLIEYYKSLKKFYPNFNKNDFEKYLSEFEIDIKLKFQKSSFGQKKKSIIAFAIASNTPVLILDEPTNGLDINSRNSFRTIINNLKDRIIFITGHNVRDLNEIIDYLIIIENGQLLFSNSIEFIKNNYKIKNIQALNGSELYYDKKENGFRAIYSEKNLDNEKIDLEFFFLYIVNKLKGKQYD